MVQSGAQAQSAPADVGDPLIGRILNDKFRIVEALGAGGMGRVYKAVQSPLERLVALKVLNPQYSEGKDPGFQKRFFLEAAVTSKLRHPNTVTIIDYGRTDDGVLYIAMEYLEGQTLAQLLTQLGPLPWMRVMNIAQQVARSLREAHKVGLIHRDLKPANIMVLNEEEDHDVVKVLDFGLVKSFLPDRGGPNETEITQAGVILGSPQYMAPEQARNVSDPRSDVYSLGVVMFQMLMGRPPFMAAQSIDVIFKHLNEAPPVFAAVWPAHTVPQEVEALVMRCLYKRPEERFQSMDEAGGHPPRRHLRGLQRGLLQPARHHQRTHRHSLARQRSHVGPADGPPALSRLHGREHCGAGHRRRRGARETGRPAHTAPGPLRWLAGARPGRGRGGSPAHSRAPVPANSRAHPGGGSGGEDASGRAARPRHGVRTRGPDAAACR
ncbi:serine/threonine-protein kinase [Archangium lansingense]|uniref:serine/threonine-protein kinase n=1 Tax=Archangium lansingense TaxID=2995310 RepID=UPI00280BA454|nr:serine/threonine-protein kinase [Archangium lansinium]